MDWTLLFLLVLAVGSLIAMAVVPRLLPKIADDGSVRVFGIKFL